MGITLNDIAAQRAMLARGEEKRKADWQAEERERLRDTFAAAALTGLLADDGDRIDHAMPDFTSRAYEWADAMLRERARTNHDAAPAARAVSTDDRTDKAAPSQCKDRPGDTPHPQATPTQGSVQGEGTVPDSRTENEPVAWAVRYAHCDTGIVDLLRTLDECRQRWINRTTDYWRYEPLYRHPPCQDLSQKNLTLTEAEREAIETAAWACGNCNGFGGVPTRPAVYKGNEIADTLRNLLERLGGER